MSQAGTLQLPDAHGYLDRVIGELRSLNTPQKNTLVSVLEYLSDHIRATRNEIGALRRDGAGNQMFSSTTDELEEIVTETARATNRIMDAAETVENVASTVGEPIVANVLMTAVTNIYEASAFQDITGQRITKVVATLKTIEAKVAHMVAAFGTSDSRPASADAMPDPSLLLNGPQLPAAAMDQSDIDKLLASFD